MVRTVRAKMEETYGVFAGDNVWYPVRVTDISEEFDRNEIVEEATDSYITPHVSAGGLAPSGSLDANFRPGAFFPILYALMGTVVPDGEYHKFTFGSPKSVSMEIQDIVEDKYDLRRFTGVGISSVDFAFSVNEFVTCTVNWFAKDYTVMLDSDSSGGDIAEKSFVYTCMYTPEEQPIVFWQAEIYRDSEVTPMLVFKDLSMTIDRGLDEEQFVLGTHYRQRLVRTGQTEVTGSIDVGEWERAELKRALFGTEQSATTDNILGNLKLTIKCAGETFEIFCPKIIYNTASRSSTGVAEIETSFDFRALNTKTEEFHIKAKKAAFTDTVTGVLITDDPTKMEYKEGEAIDLSGMEVSVTYTTADTVAGITYDQFAQYGLVASPSHGKIYYASIYEGTKIWVSHTLSGEYDDTTSVFSTES